MDGTGFTDRERRILDEIETGLREDALLDRQLRTMGQTSAPLNQLRSALHRRRLAVAGWTLAAVSLVLLVFAVQTSAPALIWAFAAAYTLTLLCVLRGVILWSRRISARARARRR
ncbi:DUF3040 domain-containing protein [Streptomyces sp. HNM0663]|uniref:DUF3040 domain-containing protein n=1 Tax=Streptomyces chengmaiensis TaxID=3040919 RepID=A0ABT6HPI1_9ACTN|nr:DUF3040 domain-containing protein [Streptomyces chengmaiensis]MDH2390241.1 DUF3040 domain-containing protein [Streptomyces chengmaiensis]